MIKIINTKGLYLDRINNVIVEQIAVIIKSIQMRQRLVTELYIESHCFVPNYLLKVIKKSKWKMLNKLTLCNNDIMEGGLN